MRKLALERIMDNNLSRAFRAIDNCSDKYFDMSKYCVGEYVGKYFGEVGLGYQAKFFQDRYQKIKKFADDTGIDANDFYAKFFCLIESEDMPKKLRCIKIR